MMILIAILALATFSFLAGLHFGRKEIKEVVEKKQEIKEISQKTKDESLHNAKRWLRTVARDLIKSDNFKFIGDFETFLEQLNYKSNDINDIEKSIQYVELEIIRCKAAAEVAKAARKEHAKL